MREKLLNLRATGRLGESSADASSRDHEQRRDLFDLESVEKRRLCIGVDAHKFEGVVVAAALQNLNADASPCLIERAGEGRA